MLFGTALCQSEIPKKAIRQSHSKTSTYFISSLLSYARRHIFVKTGFFKQTYTKGWGLFADQEIPYGTFVIEYVGEEISTRECKRRVTMAQKSKSTMHLYHMAVNADKVWERGLNYP